MDLSFGLTQGLDASRHHLINVLQGDLGAEPGLRVLMNHHLKRRRLAGKEEKHTVVCVERKDITQESVLMRFLFPYCDYILLEI